MAYFSDFDLPQKKCLNLYQSRFALDEKSVEEIGEKLGMSVDEIEFQQVVEFLLTCEGWQHSSQAHECTESHCLMNGGLLSTLVQFLKIYFSTFEIYQCTQASDVKIFLHKILESLGLGRCHRKEKKRKRRCGRDGSNCLSVVGSSSALILHCYAKGIWLWSLPALPGLYCLNHDRNAPHAFHYSHMLWGSLHLLDLFR